MQKLLQDVDFGKNLQRLRKSRNLSQYDMVAKMELLGRPILHTKTPFDWFFLSNGVFLCDYSFFILFFYFLVQFLWTLLQLSISLCLIRSQ